MSVALMTSVFLCADLNTHEKIIMLALADHANDEGECYPSVGLLTTKTSMSVRGVQTILRRLEDRGVVVIRTNGGRKGSNHFTLFIPPPKPIQTPAPDAPPHPVHPAPDAPHPRTGCTPTPAPGAPEPSYNHHLTQCVSDTHTSEQFEVFWKAHPRSRYRRETERLFKDAVSRGVDAKLIIRAAELYRAENAKNGKQYISYSDSWLKAERWKEHEQVAASVGALSDTAKTEEESALFWASIINSGRFVPHDTIRPAVVVKMVRSNLVSLDQLRSAGIEVP